MCEAWAAVTASDPQGFQAGFKLHQQGRTREVVSVGTILETRWWLLWVSESFLCCASNQQRYSAVESLHTLNLKDLRYIKSLANSDDNYAELKIKGITEKKEG